MSLTTYDVSSMVRLHRPGVKNDLEAIKRVDSAVWAGLMAIIEHVFGNADNLRRLHEQIRYNAFQLPLGAVNVCEIREFMLSDGRKVWRLKPLVEGEKWKETPQIGDYRIMFCPDPSTKITYILSVDRRADDPRGDTYAPDHPNHQRVCNRYDDLGIHRWG